MNDTVLTVLGNVGSDVRQIVTAKGALLTSFRLASTPRRPDRETGEWVDGTTTWYSVCAWRNLADNIAASLNKGDPVIVHGRLRTVAWERDGRSGETLEIEAVSVGPDLNRGRAVYRRVIRAPDLAGRSAGGTADTADTVDTSDTTGGADRSDRSVGDTGRDRADERGHDGAADHGGPDHGGPDNTGRTDEPAGQAPRPEAGVGPQSRAPQNRASVLSGG